MPSARLKLIFLLVGSSLIGCAAMNGGMTTKSSTGIPLGKTGPHAVQPIPDRPRFGQAVSEADLASWNIDIRTPDGLGLPSGRGSVAEGKKLYDTQCLA